MVNSIQKGKRVERELAAWLREQGFTDARRSQQYCGDNGDSDVVGESLSKFHVECKATSSCTLTRSTLKKWYDQVENDNKEKKNPVIFFKCNSGEFLCIVPFTAKFKRGSISVYPVVKDSFNPLRELSENEDCGEVHQLFHGYACVEKIGALIYKIEDGKHVCIFPATSFKDLFEV